MREAMACIDWGAVIAELRRHGVHYRAIACEIGVSQSTVLAWGTCGREPRHVDGELLLRLWATATRQERAFAPVARVYPSAAKASSAQG